MQSEIKNCQNCPPAGDLPKGDKHTFTIELEDFSFYEKIKVPPPTFCPECRRLARFN